MVVSVLLPEVGIGSGAPGGSVEFEIGACAKRQRRRLVYVTADARAAVLVGQPHLVMCPESRLKVTWMRPVARRSGVLVESGRDSRTCRAVALRHVR